MHEGQTSGLRSLTCTILGCKHASTVFAKVLAAYVVAIAIHTGSVLDALSTHRYNTETAARMESTHGERLHHTNCLMHRRTVQAVACGALERSGGASHGGCDVRIRFGRHAHGEGPGHSRSGPNSIHSRGQAVVTRLVWRPGLAANGV